MLGEIVGRERELAVVDALLDADRGGALVLDGAAGIGKTTVWTAAVDAARAREMRVLDTRAAEAEARLPYGTVCDLLESTRDDAVRTMPAAQRDMLDAILGRVDGEDVLRERVVAACVLTALRTLAGDARLVVAIDDLQWVDAASVAPLAYALRRAVDAGVTVVATRRDGVDGGLVLPDAARITVAPLGPDEIARVVASRLGVALDRTAIRRLTARSGGNPFFAVEFVRDGRVLENPDAPLPPSLDALLRDRVAEAPAGVRDALTVAAVHPAPTVELLERAGVEPGAIDGAIRLDLLSPIGERLAFSHPLVAAAVLSRTSAPRRREAHARVAGAVDDADEQALHLALATVRPDELVAARVEAAAERASRRGAFSDAADLAAHAVRITPDGADEARRRRMRLHGEMVGEAGDARGAYELLLALVDATPPGPERAKTCLAVARWAYDPEEHVAWCEQALAHAEGHDRAYAMLLLAGGHAGAGRVGAALEAIDAAIPLAEAAGDDDTLVLALGQRAWAQWCSGGGIAEDLLVRAAAIAGRTAAYVGAGEDPEVNLASQLTLAGEHARARPLLEKHIALAVDHGDDWARSYLLAHLGGVEARAGNIARATALSEAAVELARQVRDRFGLGAALYWRARVHSLAGDLDSARADAEEVTRTIEEVELWRVCAVDVLGYVALTLGELDMAVELLQHVLDRMHEYPWREPAPVDAQHHLAEAYVLRGEIDRAEAVLDELEEVAVPVGRVRSIGGALRVRGLAAAAMGDPDQAERLLRASLEAQARLPEPHESGRTLLHLGQVLRRANRKRDARDALAEAVEVLDRCGSRVWAERARSELDRISGRRLQTSALTETEREIARLVAEGETNQAVARALSLSPKTVEWNLSKIYRKVGVRSRTELAAQLAKRRGG